jgi:hypothetical protein
MPSLTSFEKVGRAQVFWKGIRVALQLKFGEPGLKLFPEIQELYEPELLETILDSISTAASPEDLRRLWSAPSSAATKASDQ